MITRLRYPKGYQFFDSNGNPLALGNLFYYIAGTTTPQNTYSDSAGTIANTNPIVLDGSGRLQVDVYLGSAADYKEVLLTSSVTVSPWPDDNIVRATSIAVFTGDSGSGGTSGLVPAPAAGDTLANKFLKADGTWAVTPGGSGSGATNLSAAKTATTVSISSSTGSGATIPAATSSLAGVLDSARASKIDSLATVATSGSYTDLSNKPTIPAQVNSDWNASSGVSQILNKPALASVATTGAYSDLSGKPTLGTLASLSSVNNANWSGAALATGNGGTGQTTAAGAFNALSPLTTAGDIIYGGASGAATRLGIGSSGQVLTVSGGVPAWATPSGGSGGSSGQLQFNNSGAFGGSATTTSASGELVFSGSNKYVQFQPWTPSAGPAHGPGYMGYIDYGYYGTLGTLTGVTASTTASSYNITLSAGHGLSNGQYISIAGVNYQFMLSSVGATSAQISSPASATVTNAAVQYVRINNPAMACGYNVGHVNPTEPEWAKRHEADYLDVDGFRKCETYDEFKPVGVSGAGLRPYFAQVNRDIGNIEFVELFGGRNGVTFYGSDGYSTTQVMTGEIYLSGATTYFIIGDSHNIPGSYQTNLRNLNVVNPTAADSGILTSAGNLLHTGVKDNSSSPYSEIYAQNATSGSAIPLYLQWGGGNIVFSSVGSRGASTSIGSNPLTGTQKFTFGGGGSAGNGNQLAWNINAGFSGDAVHIRGDADNYGVNSRGAFVIAANGGADTTPGDRMRVNGQGFITVYNGSGTPGTASGGAVMWANSGVFNFKDSSGNTCALPAGGTLLSNSTSANLTAGYTATSYGLGTVSSGTVTLSAASGNVQHLTNNGAFTLAPQAGVSTVELEVTNGASAGAISTSGYSKVVGSFGTTSGSVYQCVSVVTYSKSCLYITQVV